MQIGYLADLFDLLNVRDLDVIEQASERCERLVVGVFTDEYAREVLGHAPVVPFAERFELVSHVRGLSDVRAHDPSSLDGDWKVFQVADRHQGAEVGDDRRLAPRRVTASDLLAKVLTIRDRSVA